MLTDLKKQIFQKQISTYISDNNNQNLDNYNIEKKFVFKKFFIEIDFELRDNLIYYFDKENCLRLCISRTIEKEIFKTIYNNNYYFGYYRCFTRINETLFISRALNKICIYIEHCSAC